MSLTILQKRLAAGKAFVMVELVVMLTAAGITTLFRDRRS
jgi:hypothetical protein